MEEIIRRILTDEGNGSADPNIKHKEKREL